MKLPVEFLERMKILLNANEYDLFIKSFNESRYYGLRVNTIKIDVDEFRSIAPFKLAPIPWTNDGFYYEEGDNPGKHPYYYAGLYYIQEPSAMLPAIILNAKPGERILDLCAAPGGKTVQIAAGMKGKGLLVANDISVNRVKALVKNIELCGVRNAIVTNESPEKLSYRFEGFFDKILVDAPCSGEGMFRKDSDAVRSWGKYKCERCAEMQWEILQHADKILKPGGYLVYSTCTFSPEENERMVSRFIDKFKTYDIFEIPKVNGIEGGRPEWADGSAALTGTARLWPHRLKGEGHFVAMLHKKNDTQMADFTFEKSKPIPPIFAKFVSNNLTTNIQGHFYTKGNNLYCLPEAAPDISGLKVAKFGWYIGNMNRNNFEPSHSFILSMQKQDFNYSIDFSSDSDEVVRYLKGETLLIDGKKALTAVCVDGYTLGWAKQMGDMLKNLYPKGWRKLN